MRKMKQSMVVSISVSTSKDLALRRSADAFFDEIVTLPTTEIIIDFNGVSTITRSFAHQYLLRKKDIAKKIFEVHVPKNVKKMFDVVNDTNSTPPNIPDQNSIRVCAKSLWL
ncbi:MAG: DUF4325 domain-containing protein [Candidatus ainarchaeum sp.]|nr:DUF4325 domain-containing protein [Candidatus ainarchaeum sp.]